MHDDDEMQPSGFEGRGGALVEEARKMMAADDEGPKEVENNGPKIKMNRIGKKKKGQTTGGASSKDTSAPKAGVTE